MREERLDRRCAQHAREECECGTSFAQLLMGNTLSEAIMSSNEDIKRALGVGQGTLRGKLRDYYDPFEPRRAAPTAVAWSEQVDLGADFPFHPQPSWIWDSDWPAVD
jgi:hypothetical protein